MRRVRLSQSVLVLEHRLAALLVKLGDAEFFDLVLVLQTEFRLDLDLHRQAVRIPAGFAFNQESLHLLVTADHILDRAGDDMMNSRAAIGCRRTFIERKARRILAQSQSLVECVCLVPILKDCFLKFRQGSVGF